MSLLADSLSTTNHHNPLGVPAWDLPLALFQSRLKARFPALAMRQTDQLQDHNRRPEKSVLLRLC